MFLLIKWICWLVGNPFNKGLPHVLPLCIYSSTRLKLHFELYLSTFIYAGLVVHSILKGNIVVFMPLHWLEAF